VYFIKQFMGVTKTPPQKHDEELKKLETLIQRLNNKRNEAAHEYKNHKQNASDASKPEIADRTRKSTETDGSRKPGIFARAEEKRVRESTNACSLSAG
jgi:hypothetical protein